MEDVNPVGLWKLVHGGALVRIYDVETFTPLERRSGQVTGVWELFASVEVIKAGGYTDLPDEPEVFTRVNEELRPVMPIRPYVLFTVIQGPLQDGYRGRWALRVMRSLGPHEMGSVTSNYQGPPVVVERRTDGT